MKKIIIVLLCLAIGLACNIDKKTSEVIIVDKQDFAMKLADMYFIDAWMTRASKKDRDSLKTKFSNEFLDLYGIKIEDFHKELAQLKQDPILFAEIMDSVGVVLNNKGNMKK